MTVTFGTIAKITDNAFDDRLPAVIDGNRIAFGQVDGANRSIALWQGGGIVFVNTDPNNFLGQQFIEANSNGEIVWTRQFAVGDNDVYRYDGTNVVRVDFSAQDASFPSIARAGTYVYQLGPANILINDSVTGQRTIAGTQPDSDGNRVAYINGGGQVEVFDFSSNTTQTITNSAFGKASPRISGNTIVWTEANGPGASNEIMLATLGGGGGPQIERITNNNNDDNSPDIFNGTVVWQRFNGSDNDIMLYDSSTRNTQEVTPGRSANSTDPSIGPNRIAWVENDGDNEIFSVSYTPAVTPPPPTQALTLRGNPGGTAQIAYVVYYGRPSDAGGANFWNNGALAGFSYSPRGNDPLTGNEINAYNTFVNSFGNSPENTRLNQGLNTFQQVDSIYRFAFNRGAENGPNNFWVNEINSGRVNLTQAALEIGLGAQNQDLVVLNNKIASATLFSNSIDTPAEINAYSGITGETFGRNWLAPFGNTAATQTQVDAALNALVAGQPPPI